ncbi:hypothetical protein DPSP01_009291 [Paraphaeosphaeria sporulosa]
MVTSTRIEEMKNPSIVLYKAGHAKVQDAPVPEIVDPHDVLVRIAFVGVCGSDVSMHLPISSYHSTSVIQFTCVTEETPRVLLAQWSRRKSRKVREWRRVNASLDQRVVRTTNHTFQPFLRTVFRQLLEGAHLHTYTLDLVPRKSFPRRLSLENIPFFCEIYDYHVFIVYAFIPAPPAPSILLTSQISRPHPP